MVAGIVRIEPDGTEMAISKSLMSAIQQLFQTTETYWIMPGRIAIGSLLIRPINGGMETLLLACHSIFVQSEFNHVPNFLSVASRLIEVVAGLSVLIGFAVRIAIPIAVTDFAINIFSGVPEPFGCTTTTFIIVHARWLMATIYLAAIILASDLFHVGGGGLSIDYWISRNLFDRRNSKFR